MLLHVLVFLLLLLLLRLVWNRNIKAPAVLYAWIFQQFLRKQSDVDERKKTVCSLATSRWAFQSEHLARAFRLARNYFGTQS